MIVKEKDRQRLVEIIELAKKLEWIYPIDQPNIRHFSYPLMQLSEVEKCMLAMIDDKYLERMRDWGKEVDDGTWEARKAMAEKLKKHQEKMTEEVTPY